MEQLHEKAAAAYNEKLTSLLSKLKPLPPAEPKPRVQDDVHVVRHLGPDDIKPPGLRMFREDYTGARKACRFSTSLGMVELTDEDHEAFARVTTKIAEARAYRDCLSADFVYEKAVDWLQRRTDAPHDTSPYFTEFLHTEAMSAVKWIEVWLPIPAVKIAGPFAIGDVTFCTITKKMMDELVERIGGVGSAADTRFDDLRSRLQGATAVCVGVEAEPTRANQLASERAEAAVAMLRLCCPTILNPHAWAPIEPSSFNSLGGFTVVHVSQGKIESLRESFPEGMNAQWLIRSQDIQDNFRRVWGFGHSLIATQRNEFQQTLLIALIHFSRSVLKPDPAERLLYVVSALESLFIKDSNENIGQNLRERLAVLAGPTPADRLKRAETVTRIYALRSRFVHAGIGLSEVEQLEEFFIDAWATFIFLIQNYNKWQTKAAFLRSLDEHKFTGPAFSTAKFPPA